MLGQLVFDEKLNIVTRLQKSIDRVRMFEPQEGYYLAFSGGKDSIATYHLMALAGVKFDAHYQWTTVDPPELLYFIEAEYPDVEIEMPERTMWQLIEDKLMPPTWWARYCCAELKEHGGEGRFTATGVRWAESPKRKNTRSLVEFDVYGSQSKKAIDRRELFLNSDNDERRKMIETCVIKGKNVLNPIIDWSDADVWNFIKSNGLKYPSLYDEGRTRIGCIGCPLQGRKGMERDFKRWPKHRANYVRAYDRMIKKRLEKGLETTWKNGEEALQWQMGK